MLPEAFTMRMQDLLKDEFEAFYASYDLPQKKGLRINRLKPNAAALTDTWPLQPVDWYADGYYYEETVDFRPGIHPYHDAGVYYIQEPSAMSAVPYLEIREGDIVLDLCAAPGGKSTQIAAALNGSGLLVANEIVPGRAKILSENIERMGVRNAVVTNETPQRLSAHFPVFFNKILVDAPCSGEGMFRKNDNATDEWSPQNVQLCADRQDEILAEAAKMLAPGGRLVYSTCTFSPEEDEGSVTRFLQTHPDFHIVAPAPFAGADSGRRDWYPDAPDQITQTIRLFPHHVKGEGHYLAVLEKDGVLHKAQPIKKKTQKLPKEAASFIEEIMPAGYAGLFEKDPKGLVPSGNLRIELFGDQIYLLPDLISIKGLKVLRAGLHIGTLKKGRFEPSHALALTLTKDDVFLSTDLPADADTFDAADYRKGLTFPLDAPKGWYLITADGYAFSWGKLAGGVMKNHYPKGLRR